MDNTLDSPCMRSFMLMFSLLIAIEASSHLPDHGPIVLLTCQPREAVRGCRCPSTSLIGKCRKSSRLRGARSVRGGAERTSKETTDMEKLDSVRSTWSRRQRSNETEEICFGQSSCRFSGRSTRLVSKNTTSISVGGKLGLISPGGNAVMLTWIRNSRLSRWSPSSRVKLLVATSAWSSYTSRTR